MLAGTGCSRERSDLPGLGWAAASRRGSLLDRPSLYPSDVRWRAEDPGSRPQKARAEFPSMCFLLVHQKEKKEPSLPPCCSNTAPNPGHQTWKAKIAPTPSSPAQRRPDPVLAPDPLAPDPPADRPLPNPRPLGLFSFFVLGGTLLLNMEVSLCARGCSFCQPAGGSAKRGAVFCFLSGSQPPRGRKILRCPDLVERFSDSCPEGPF